MNVVERASACSLGSSLDWAVPKHGTSSCCRLASPPTNGCIWVVAAHGPRLAVKTAIETLAAMGIVERAP